MRSQLRLNQPQFGPCEFMHFTGSLSVSRPNIYSRESITLIGCSLRDFDVALV